MAAPKAIIESETMYTVEEVAGFLHFSTRHVRRLIKTGKLRAHRVSIRALRITDRDLRACVAASRQVKL